MHAAFPFFGFGRLSFDATTRSIFRDGACRYTADNGPHSAGRDRQQFCALAGTNGLRQCKASLYEGGIRVPGILQWPAVVQSHSETWHPAYVSDYLPTVLELLGVPHENPSWVADGISLLPLIKQLAAAPNTNDTSLRAAENPLVFQLGSQMAIVNNQWKILQKPAAGQCDAEHGSFFDKTMLFNLDLDPTESTDLSTDPTHASLFTTMSAQLKALAASITASTITESQCASAGPSPGPAPPSPPLPPQPPTSGFQIKVNDSCLTVTSLGDHPAAVLGACDGGSKWDGSTSQLTNVAVGGGMGCLKIHADGVKAGHECDAGNAVTIGACKNDLIALQGGSLSVPACPKMCAAPASTASGVVPVVLAPCGPATAVWTKV